MAVSARELHTRYYWKTMQDGIAKTSLTEYQDELDTISIMTDSPILKEACWRNIHRFDHLGSTKRPVRQ